MSEIDLGFLQEEFGITQEPVEVEYSFPEEEVSPEKILQENVVKANIILDRVIAEMTGGSFSARLVEVASKAVDSITNIASTMGNISSQFADLQTKLDMVKLKQKQLEIQEKRLPAPSKVIENQQNNFIVTNREDLLKMLKDERTKQIKENV